MLRGSPGTGKTTFGLQFVCAGGQVEGELGLFVTFEELPDQLYAEAANFGWDLRALERQNLLRVIATSPDLLLDGLQQPGGFLERMVGNAKRVVIDSVTLLEQLTSPENLRDRFYRLRSALKRRGLTAVLIEENSVSGAHGALSFLADGVINLYFEEKPDGYRAREMEVLKLRGTSFVSGRHLFRIENSGISVHPALTTQDILPLAGSFAPTQIPQLDTLLGGGIPDGATVLLDANSRAEYRYLAGVLVASLVSLGQGLAVTVSGSTFPEAQQQQLVTQLGLNFTELIEQGRLLLLDNHGVDIPGWAEPFTNRLCDLDDTGHHTGIRNIIKERLRTRDGQQWVWYRDLNTLVSVRGETYLKRYFAEQSALCRTSGVTTLCLINGTETGHALLSHLQRVSTVVLRSWVDGRYQYLEVMKSPTGRVSEPFLMQYGPDFPFVLLK